MALETSESSSSDGMCKPDSPVIDVEQSESQSAPPSPASPPPMPAGQQIPQPLRLTNFFIAEILKPDFGICQRKKPHHRDLYVNPGLCMGLPLSDSPRQADPDPVSYHNHHHHHHHHPGHLSPAHSTASSTSSGSSSSIHNSSSNNNSPKSSGQSSTSPRLPDLDQLQTSPEKGGSQSGEQPILWPAWVYCTRYSDRPSSGRSPRSRKMKKKADSTKKEDEKRPRTAFTNEQLGRLKKEFDENRYLTETRRQELARDLKLNESQIKIWFQNKRAKMKKSQGGRNGLALQLMAQGLYNHATVPVLDDSKEDQ